MNNSPLENLFAELEELNRKIIELCCNHRRYADKIPDKLNDYMAEAAYTEYVQQHELHLQKLIAAANTELYNIQTVAAISTPAKRRRWYWPWSFKRNKAAEAIDAKFAEYTQSFIEQILARADDMKNEFCRSWAKLLQQAELADPAEPAAVDDAEPAAADDAAPAQPTAAQERPAETWEEDDAIIPYEALEEPPQK